MLGCRMGLRDRTELKGSGGCWPCDDRQESLTLLPTETPQLSPPAFYFIILFKQTSVSSRGFSRFVV